jgi:hypothetical protein
MGEDTDEVVSDAGNRVGTGFGQGVGEVSLEVGRLGTGY